MEEASQSDRSLGTGEDDAEPLSDQDASELTNCSSCESWHGLQGCECKFKIFPGSQHECCGGLQPKSCWGEQPESCAIYPILPSAAAETVTTDEIFAGRNGSIVVDLSNFGSYYLPEKAYHIDESKKGKQIDSDKKHLARAEAEGIRVAAEFREHVDGVRPFDGVMLWTSDDEGNPIAQLFEVQAAQTTAADPEPVQV